MDWTRRHLSIFTRARDDQRDDIAQQIHDLANTNIAALNPCGITAATLLAFQTRISAYVAAIGSPCVARTKISTATEMLDTEWSELGSRDIDHNPRPEGERAGRDRINSPAPT